MIFYKQFNIINVNFYIFFHFFKLKYFLNATELPNILEFFKCIFFER